MPNFCHWAKKKRIVVIALIKRGDQIAESQRLGRKDSKKRTGVQ